MSHDNNQNASRRRAPLASVGHYPVKSLVTIILALLGCSSSSSSDMENVCHAGQRAKVSGTGADRAHQTWQWIDAHVKSKEVRRSLEGMYVFETPREKAVALRQLAKESGYDGPCPMADELEAEPERGPTRSPREVYGTPESEARRADELRSAASPIGSAASELNARGRELYGLALPVAMTYADDSIGLEAALGRLGCPQPGLAALDKKGKELLGRCKPHGPGLLERYPVAAEATVGCAALALTIEALAPDETRASPVHQALVGALLGRAAKP
jgi:hypothetical protein